LKVKLERIKRKSGEKASPIHLIFGDVALIAVLWFYLYHQRLLVGELLTGIMFLRVMWTIDAWIWK